MLVSSFIVLTLLLSYFLYRSATRIQIPWSSLVQKVPEIPWVSRWQRKSREKRQLIDLICCMRQLLYLRDLPLNLHSKLQKCVPVTTAIRVPLVHLIHEWYVDPLQAISKFRSTLRHDQADGFCDTLRAMFEVGEAPFYGHLQSRMDDLKLLLRQQQEAQKETRSYIFFILAGIPLIHSFQLFLYPWLAQSSSIFQAIH